MSQLSFGIIETIGLSTAIQVADLCVKSANVNLIGYELTKGEGMTVVKIEGSVGAVKAAVDAALASTDKIAFSKVIARPNEEIEILIRNNETVGFKKQKDEENLSFEIKEEVEEIKEVVEEIKEVSLNSEENSNEKDEELELKDSKKIVDEKNNQSTIKKKKYTCNICKDPECTRIKGELLSNCIHHENINVGG